jgi:hypothetical protein
MKRTPLLIVVALAIVAVLLFLRRPAGERPQPTNDKALSTTREARSNSVPLSVNETATNSVSVPPVILSEINRFITAANPHGVEQIKLGDVLGVSDDGRRFMLETKTHLAEFFTKGLVVPRLHHFIAMQDASNPVAKPEGKRDAMRQWYKATGQWSNEEALAETYRIMERLGIQFNATRYEVDAPKLGVKDPQGRNVEVTPFYMVKLYNANDTMVLDAEFRVSEAGPGRLTMWWANLPPEAYR